jgi:transcriptional regulator with XRE-family HTH domain
MVIDHGRFPLNLRELLKSRGITQDAAAVLAGVDRSTISLILSGKTRARATTIVKLAKALGIGASRMQSLCEAHWLEAHPDECVTA